ncbi:OCIA domain-containing protein 2 isoform X2 [Oncorhynchus clarkii lewisi]|uniref:OCIA domain-containing protein 2 isoform X2 n=1 Tax=Oncorhynchus clarkii lewisi TaxID=490388 RepID=UPI0039B96369
MHCKKLVISQRNSIDARPSVAFWPFPALPLSLGSMAVSGGLIYKGVWSASKRLGPFPKLAAAGVLGYAVGKASYVTTCRNKFQRLGPVFGPESEYGFGPGPFGGRGSGPGHRYCHHVCEECKQQQAPAAPIEGVQS